MSNVLILGCANPSARAVINCIKLDHMIIGLDIDPILLAASNADIKIAINPDLNLIDQVSEIVFKHGIHYIQPQTEEFSEFLKKNKETFLGLVDYDNLKDTIIPDSIKLSGKLIFTSNKAIQSIFIATDQEGQVMSYDPTIPFTEHDRSPEERYKISTLSLCYPIEIEFIKELGLNYPLYDINSFYNARLQEFIDFKFSEGHDEVVKTAKLKFLPVPEMQFKDAHIHTWVRGIDHAPVHLISPSKYDLEKLTPEQVKSAFIAKGITKNDVEPNDNGTSTIASSTPKS